MSNEIFCPVPGCVVSMTAEAASGLIRAGSGDAALLYLCLLQRGGDLAGSRKALGWPETRLLEAWQVLVNLKLAKEALPSLPDPLPEPTDPPDYTAADITRELERSSFFSGLVEETQRRLGKVLSTTDLKILYTLYDFLALPAEVILLLITWCIGQTQAKYGPGRMPTLPQIRSEAFRWKRQGIDTAEAAEDHLRRMAELNTATARLLPLVGITGRAPVDSERKYLEQWTELGFEDAAIRLAYEKTVLKKQSMNWPYMNSILKSWHRKGLYTVSRIQTEDSALSSSGAAFSLASAPLPKPGEADQRVREDVERMRRFMEKLKQEEGGNGDV